uniref:Glycolipid transfer protein domain-containing protein n=1 Tax=Oryza glumipatula TaxID=40148 RepID=A0A0D9ZJ85_9ORYZ
MATGGKALRKFSGAFQALAQKVGPRSPPMTVKDFTKACSELQSLINLMGEETSTWFADYGRKVEQIQSRSRGAATLKELVEQDMANNTVKAADSNTTILLRLMRALQVVKVLFEQLLKGRGVEFQSAATTAYMVVFGAYHKEPIQNMVKRAISSLPTRAWLMNKINEEEGDIFIEMRKYVDASAAVINYIEELFTSNGLEMNW